LPAAADAADYRHVDYVTVPDDAVNRRAADDDDVDFAHGCLVVIDPLTMVLVICPGATHRRYHRKAV
jgi:hypothetical protein